MNRIQLIRAKDTIDFIKISKEKYPNQYEYQNTKYKGEFMNIYIYCKKHNEKIKIKPYFHLNSSKGCTKCKN
jgi:hypothetical protein